jgi:hypothetical protein
MQLDSDEPLMHPIDDAPRISHAIYQRPSAPTYVFRSHHNIRIKWISC